MTEVSIGRCDSNHGQKLRSGKPLRSRVSCLQVEFDIRQMDGKSEAIDVLVRGQRPPASDLETNSLVPSWQGIAVMMKIHILRTTGKD